MKWLPSKDNYMFYIIILILLFIFTITIGIKQINQKENKHKEIDSLVINYKIIDSIKYNIEYKDSIIRNIEYIYEEKIIEANNMSDSASIELFKSLCTN